MFMTEIESDKITDLMIEDYFNNVRSFCTQDLSKKELDTVERTGILLMQTMVQAILQSATPDRQVEIFHRIQMRFMMVLQDYNRDWIWAIFSEFSDRLPEKMLN
jgi:hypothetical protein